MLVNKKKYSYTGEWINVAVRKKTHDNLKILGDATQSFNEIIENLLVEKAPQLEAIRAAKAPKSVK